MENMFLFLFGLLLMIAAVVGLCTFIIAMIRLGLDLLNDLVDDWNKFKDTMKERKQKK